MPNESGLEFAFDCFAENGGIRCLLGWLDVSRVRRKEQIFNQCRAIVASIFRLAYYEQALTHVSWSIEGLIDLNRTIILNVIGFTSTDG